MYDIDELEVDNLTDATEIGTKLEEMIRKGELPPGLTPLGRMFISEIKTKGVPTTHFLCVSWHGSHNSRKSRIVRRIQEFISLYERNWTAI